MCSWRPWICAIVQISTLLFSQQSQKSQMWVSSAWLCYIRPISFSAQQDYRAAQVLLRLFLHERWEPNERLIDFIVQIMVVHKWTMNPSRPLVRSWRFNNNNDLWQLVCNEIRLITARQNCAASAQLLQNTPSVPPLWSRANKPRPNMQEAEFIKESVQSEF